jgi:predicted lipoprotein with Yx(FWY)xxD motif
MRKRLISVLPVCVLIAGGGAGVAMAMTPSLASKPTVKTAKTTKYGIVLVATNGHMLYRFTPDRKRVSTCKGACLGYWPKLLVKTGVKPSAGSGVTASMLGTINAGHGMAQVTYGGYPLYYYAGDTKAGQTNGEGVLKTWYVVNTKGALVKKPVSTTTTTNTTTTTTTTSTGSGGGGWG